MSDGDGAGGLFLVAWGAYATGFGWIVATDFRGAAHRLHRTTLRDIPFDPPSWATDPFNPLSPRSAHRWAGVPFFRKVAAVFALIGPVVLVSGVMKLLQGEMGPSGRFRLPVPFPLFIGLLGVFWLWLLWRRDGPLRREWADGAGLQRAATVVMTAAIAGFVTAMALGHLNAVLAMWLLGGLASLVLLLSGSDDRDFDPP